VDGGVIFALFCIIMGTYILSCIADFAEESRTNKIKNKIKQEVIRRYLQKKRVDELYGRDDDTLA